MSYNGDGQRAAKYRSKDIAAAQMSREKSNRSSDTAYKRAQTVGPVDTAPFWLGDVLWHPVK